MEEREYTVIIHAPEIEARSRHEVIIESFDSLEPGEFLELSNDHDPKPLHYQLMIEREGTFTWDYLQNGPTLWRVSIGKSKT